MYADFVKPLRDEIIKWLNVDVWPQNDMHITQRCYPYITYYMWDDFDQYEFDPNAPDFNIGIQFKVVSDDEQQQKELKYKLRRLFSLSEPKYYLHEHGLALLKIASLPSPVNYIENAIIYDDGWDMTFNVHLDDVDFTIPGEMDWVESDFHDSTRDNKEEN